MPLVRREIDISLQIPAVKIRDLSFSYNHKQVLKDINLEVRQGEIMVIIGPNGGGKTTLLRIILGLLSGYEGEVEVFGRPARETPKRKGLVGYLPQHHQMELRFPILVKEVIGLGFYGPLGLVRRPGRAEMDEVSATAERLGISDLLDMPLSELSTGQQQRVFLARAIVARPHMLLLDEPMVGVDESGQAHLLDNLLHLNKDEGVTILSATHNILSLGKLADKVACLDMCIHFHDIPKRLTREKLLEVYKCDYAMFEELARVSEGEE